MPFLQKEPRLRKEDDVSKHIICSMQSVNNIAERGVTLLEEFNNLITTNEEQK